MTEPDPLAEDARAAADGDQVAARRLCIALSPVILGTLRRVLGVASPDLEDLLQDSLMGVLDGLAAFKGNSSLKHYARRVAMLRALETVRNARSRAQKLAMLGQSEPQAEDDDPGEALSTKRLREHLHELLRALPRAQAETLMLQSVLGHSLAETAEMLGVPVNTARGRLQTAKQALRARIENEPALAELLEPNHDER